MTIRSYLAVSFGTARKGLSFVDLSKMGQVEHNGIALQAYQAKTQASVNGVSSFAPIVLLCGDGEARNQLESQIEMQAEGGWDIGLSYEADILNKVVEGGDITLLVTKAYLD